MNAAPLFASCLSAATACGRMVALRSHAITAACFLVQAKQIEAVMRASLFARVEPAHKQLIVELLQREGEVVPPCRLASPRREPMPIPLVAARGFTAITLMRLCLLAVRG